MRVSVILAHPNPASFNHGLAKAAAAALRDARHLVAFHDLYAEGFDPLLPAAEITKGARCPAEVETHCEELASAEGIVIVHPDWWGMPPAVLVGWVDRVVRPGVAYEFGEGDSGEGVPCGLLKVRTAVVLNTSDTEPAREREVFGDPLERIWRDCVFRLCGVRDVRRRNFGIVVTSTREQRRAWLDEAAAMVADAFPGSSG